MKEKISWKKLRKKFFRLTIDGEVRLKSAYIIKTNREKDENGEITTIYATYDEESKSGEVELETSMRKVKERFTGFLPNMLLPIEVRIMTDYLLTNNQMQKRKQISWNL